MENRMNPCRLNIGAYILQPYARTERHIREIAECGLNFIVCMGYDIPTLDLFHKYGVGAVVNGVVPGWWGGNGDNAGKMEASNPVEKYREAAGKFVDHPAIWGIDIGDEPSALDFEHYGRVVRLTQELFPNQFPYLNLYPNYASVAGNTPGQVVSQLGTASYEEHIARYVEHVPTDYISYDHYMYSTGRPELAYENLRVVAGACRGAGRSMWIVLQANSNRENEHISENQLRHQVYSSMAFGAEVIMWACYTAGWWHDNVLDANGDKTGQYEKLRIVNGEISCMGGPYMEHQNRSTHLIGFKDRSPEQFSKITEATVDCLDAGMFSGVRAEHGERVIAGHMTRRDLKKGEALMLADASGPNGENESKYRVLFRCEGSDVRAWRNGGEIPVKRESNGDLSVEMMSCAGVLVTAK